MIEPVSLKQKIEDELKEYLKTTLLFSLFVTVSFSSALNDTSKSIVKVFTTASTPNYKYPW